MEDDQYSFARSVRPHHDLTNDVANSIICDPKARQEADQQHPAFQDSGNNWLAMIPARPVSVGRKTTEMFSVRDKYRLASLSTRQTNADTTPTSTITHEFQPQQLSGAIQFCSLFPKGYEFGQLTLVQLWMAQGFIHDEVHGAILFDNIKGTGCIMFSRTDLLTGEVKYNVDADRVQAHVGEKMGKPLFLRLENDGKKLNDIPTEDLLHVSVAIVDGMVRTAFDALRKANKLKTLLILHRSAIHIKQVPSDLFLVFTSLKALDLSGTCIEKLPRSIGNLIHLRYLDLSSTHIERLPETIDCLSKLQTLKLHGCKSLFELPREMKKLTELRHLEFDILGQLDQMPERLGALTNLQTLSAFIVDEEDGCSIEELKNLNNLRGNLCISKLENVLIPEEAKEAALGDKKYVKKLELLWSDPLLPPTDEGFSAMVLDHLRPNSQLEDLQISCFGDTILPSWISDPSFHKLVSIVLFRCENLLVVPCTGYLPSLKFLHLIEIDGAVTIHQRQENDLQVSRMFPKLEELVIDGMANLAAWYGMAEGDFPCLLKLTIKYCPNVFELCFPYIDTLQHLEVGHCSSLRCLPQSTLSNSVESLIIVACPLFQNPYTEYESDYWEKTRHVPNVWINHQQIRTTDDSLTVALEGNAG